MRIGRHVFGLGAVVLGVTGLVFGTFDAMGMPVPRHTPGYVLLAYAGAGLLLAAGLAIAARRTARIGALVLAGLFGLNLLALAAPAAAAQPMVWVSWENVAETTVKLLGAVLVYAEIGAADMGRAAAIRRIVRPVFGACLVVFGISEFVYAGFTASLVPAWLPPSQLFWSYATGAAQIAAGLAVASGLAARPAAWLLTAMYVIFSLIVHLPRVAAHPDLLGAWAENGVNVVLAGAAWLLADALGRAKAKS